MSRDDIIVEDYMDNIIDNGVQIVWDLFGELESIDIFEFFDQ